MRLISTITLLVLLSSCSEQPGFRFYRNAENSNHPSCEGQEITLTPEDVYDGAGVCFLSSPAPRVPYVISFEYNIWDADGGLHAHENYNSADGICVMLGVDEKPYKEFEPPSGRNLGYLEAAGGMALMFKTYGTRRIELMEGSWLLDRQTLPEIYTNGTWQPVRLEVTQEGLTVLFGEREVFRWSGTVPSDNTSIAFGAATGGSNSLHQVRNIALSPKH